MRRGPLAVALWPISVLFQALTSLRCLMYRRGILQVMSVGRPVIVVGNLIVGGAGKTPLVIALVEALRTRGYSPGVISRGYGGSAVREGVVASASGGTSDGAGGSSAIVGPGSARAGSAGAGSGAADAVRLGDEIALITRRTAAPVAVGRDRVAAALCLLNDFPQVDLIISDDGLQHYRLARAVEIAVFDARGAGNGWLLPAGPLREPLSRLREVDVLVLNGDQAHAGIMNGAGAAAQASRSAPASLPPSFRMHVRGALAFRLNDAEDIRPLAAFRQTALLAVAGIAQPGRFFDMLQSAGLQFETLALPDHFDYRGHSFTSHPAEIILMTEKDAVKCEHLTDPRLWVVPIDAEIDAGLVDLILEKLRGSAPA